LADYNLITRLGYLTSGLLLTRHASI